MRSVVLVSTLRDYFKASIINLPLLFFSATTIARGLRFVCRKEVTKKGSKLGVSKISLVSIPCKNKQISGIWQFSNIAYMRKKEKYKST